MSAISPKKVAGDNLSNLQLLAVGKSLLNFYASAHDEIQGLCPVALAKHLGPSRPLFDLADGGQFL